MAGLKLRELTLALVAGFSVSFIVASAQAAPTPRIKPAAPGPVYMTRADHALLTSAAAALKKKQFSLARANIKDVEAPIAHSLGNWMYMMAEDPTVSLFEADAFLDAHPDWPAISRIQRYVEKRIPNTASAKSILEFYESRDPVSGDGKIQLARALFATGDEKAGEIHVRDAWINHNFSSAEEKRILAVYGNRLTEHDHAARVDRLLWGRQVTNARRVIPKLNRDDRRKAQARAALLLGAANGPRLFQNLSLDAQNDSGVLHAATRYYRRSGSEQFAISLSKKAPRKATALRNPERWWYERRLLMRWALKNGRYADAYSVAADHGIEAGGDLSVAEFNAGWIALRFLNEPERAETHFLALASAVRTPISLSRAYYWLGRAAAAQGKDDLAASYYQNASQHYYSYYGQLAAEELGGEALNRTFAPPSASTPQDKALFTSRPTVAALRMLGDLGFDYEFMVFAYHIDDQLERPGEYLELAKLTNGEGAPHLTVRAGKVSVQKNAFAPEVSYPLVFVPEEASRYVPREIILGLSRQESEFNPRAYSSAGARGVMQLIPSTAQLTARKEGLRYSRSALLDDPVYNMTLGSAHLSHLLERFNGSLIMTFAAYNAGPHRVDQWVATYGDPRTPHVDPLDWVELIPFSETRNYVQRVLENIQVYRGRINNTPIPGRLSMDLERGGSGQRAAKLDIPSAHLAKLAAANGKQGLSPLPKSTAERVRKFKIAQAGLAPAPVTQTAPLEPLTLAQPPLEADSASNKIEKEPAPTAIATGPTKSSIHANELFTKLRETLASTPATDTENTSEANAAPEAAPRIALPAAEEPDPEVIKEILLKELIIADKAVAAPPETNAKIEPETEEPAQQTIALPDRTEPLFEAFDEPEQRPVTAGLEIEFIETPDLTEIEKCLAYRDFLARNAEEETAAQDLNANMLAELQSDTENEC
ncbi:MAG: lytic transglycosylase domain-containing protein [Marinicaulis sp.]|nr:lytic transglycosylase domain-containing protein [Marinicaulis sp.]